MTRLALTLLLVLAPLAPMRAAMPPAVGDTPLPTLAPMIKKVSPAVVNIATRGTIRERGGQNPLQNISQLYSTPTWSRAVATYANDNQVEYVETDTRLTKSLPPAGTYFPGDTNLATSTIPPANLTKYNKIQGVAKVYDDGTIAIYDLVTQGYMYVPPQP